MSKSLLPTTGKTREIQSLEGFHEKNLPSDGIRRQQAVAVLILKMAYAPDGKNFPRGRFYLSVMLCEW